ncbi:hypothetical protein H696_05712 [Fonticula alba]|uniref:BPL/LPL catalytic domain-containing protein n=1 Tax=Fonticula alba TaxID=691883 RepID=A0A058Z0H0_FONAL|nr:hypothetical protein H696_05712 [Fonticula alba]KCV67769.1 hypothetical protein H696_05712 [Fonticula alba]|eukprot:XP_009497800.1 hypothetical protein H696_05712 [Fonticula alba]
MLPALSSIARGLRRAGHPAVTLRVAAFYSGDAAATATTTPAAAPKPNVVPDEYYNLEKATPDTLNVFYLESTDPFLNLATEEWLFRSLDVTKTRVLMFYQNRPCIVVGRNQNLWTELNPRRLAHLNGLPGREPIALVRRRSGGGSVFHDLGNTNWSLVSHRTIFDKAETANIIAGALNRLDVVDGASTSARQDVLVGGDKVSGAAYSIIRDRALHHATMLLSADLNMLRGTLSGEAELNITSRGVKSVSSPVRNLRVPAKDQPGELVALQAMDFSKAVVEELRAFFEPKDVVFTHMPEATMRIIPDVIKNYEELRSWDWFHGQNPNFEQAIRADVGGWELSLRLKSERGLIVGIEIESCSAPPLPVEHPISQEALLIRLHGFCEALTGQRYNEAHGVASRHLERFGSGADASGAFSLGRALQEAIVDRYFVPIGLPGDAP